MEKNDFFCMMLENRSTTKYFANIYEIKHIN